MTTPASQPRIPRRVTNTLGTWDVVHPFSGEVEFSHTNRELVHAVAAEFDQREPVSIDWLFDTLKRAAGRHGVCWVMSRDTLQWARLVKDTTGRYIFNPGMSTAEPDHMLGLPIAIDDKAVGMAVMVPDIAR